MPGNIFCQNTAWNDSRLLNAQWNVHLKSFIRDLIYAAVLYMYDTLYAIVNKSENATLQILYIFWESIGRKVLITWLFLYCKGGNFNIHIWVWFGYFIS